jgi:histidinol-phosphate aminotransferase
MPFADDLRAAIAELHGIAPECVVTGCGSDGVLEPALRAFTQPGDRFAWHDPTFSMVPALASVHSLVPAPVPCPGAPSAVTVDELFGSSPAAVYLCSPNNPTGARSADGLVDAVRRRLRDAASPPLVILDQAYAEFDEGDVPERFFTTDEPVLVTRTLSKAYGLAGLRVGYGIAPPAIVVAIEKARGPYAVGAIAERAAVAALTDDRVWMRVQVAEAVALRARFMDALRARGLAPLESAANFVLVPVANAAAADAALRARGVAVRAFERLAGIGDALRITIGPWPMLERCLEALAEVPR